MKDQIVANPHQPLAAHIVDIEQIVVGLLRAQLRAHVHVRGRWPQERTLRLGVGGTRGNRDQLFLRPA